VLDRAADAVEALLTDGLAAAQNAFHSAGTSGTCWDTWCSGAPGASG